MQSYFYTCSTYLISAPIVPYYYTQLIGDAKDPPTLLASSTFDGFAVIGMPFYLPWTKSRDHLLQMLTHIFNPAVINIFGQLPTCTYFEHLWLIILNPLYSFRSIRNFIIDVRQSVLFPLHLISDI